MKNEVIKNELKITYPIEAKLFMFDVLRVDVFYIRALWFGRIQKSFLMLTHLSKKIVFVCLRVVALKTEKTAV